MTSAALPDLPVVVGVTAAPATLLSSGDRWWLNYGVGVAVPVGARVLSNLAYFSTGAASAQICSGSFNNTTNVFTITDFENVSLSSGLTTFSGLSLSMNPGDILAVRYQTLPSSVRHAAAANVTIYSASISTSPTVGGTISGWSASSSLGRALQLYGSN